MNFIAAHFQNEKMDDKHRKVIKENISKLVQHTNFKDLLKTCREERLLSQQMVENLYLDSKNLYEFGRSPTLEEIQHQKLFEKITHRGPEAFQKLIKILRYLDNVEALQILEREKEFYSIREKIFPVFLKGVVALPKIQFNKYQYQFQYKRQTFLIASDQKLMKTHGLYLKSTLGQYLQSKNMK